MTTYLEQVLAREVAGMDLLQALRLIQLVHPDRAPVGTRNADPSQEVVSFSVRPSFAFPPGDVHAWEPAEKGPDRLVVNTFGLIGVDGVLPHLYTEMVAREERAGDEALRDFFDLFQHRLLSLLVRALRRADMAASWESGDGDEDRLLARLGDLIGVTTSRTLGRGLSPAQVAPFAALAGPQRRSAYALELLLEGRFGVPVEVEPFIGAWIRLSDDDLCELGSDGPSTRLGWGAVVGDEIWDAQARVRVRLGPLDRETFDAFLPGGAHHENLREICRFFVHDQFVVEACLILERDDVPECVVSDEDDGPALGWSTWLRTGPLDRDPDETLLTLS